MAAGQGFIEFSTGDILTAAAANGYLASQVVMVFADAAARTAAITSPQEGMMSYLKDTNATEYYSGSAWAAIGAVGGYTLISEQVASASTGIDFTSIPSTHKHLVLTWSGINQSALSTPFGIRLNSSTSNYKEQYQYQESGATPSLTATGSGTQVGDAAFGVQLTSTNAHQMAQGSLIIYDYASASKYKYYTTQYSYYSNNNARVNFVSLQGFYADNTAISSVNIVRLSGTGTMSNLANTSIRLYGVS